MDKPDPVCPTCHQPAKLWREVNAVMEFWECEGKHVFSVEKKPPPRLSAAAAAREAAHAAEAAQAAEAAAAVSPPVTASDEKKP